MPDYTDTQIDQKWEFSQSRRIWSDSPNVISINVGNGWCFQQYNIYKTYSKIYQPNLLEITIGESDKNAWWR